jgi:transcriptional regulator with XRE-family HTH domain
MNDEIVAKIKKLCTAKGLSQAQIADSLNITRTAYQKMESGESCSWAKYLDELMNLLETTPKDFFSDIGRQIFNQTNYDGSIGYVASLNQENKETMQKLISNLENEISHLKEEIAFLHDLLNKK